VPRVIVKICGLSTAPTLEAAIGAGADMAASCSMKKARVISTSTRREALARSRRAGSRKWR